MEKENQMLVKNLTTHCRVECLDIKIFNTAYIYIYIMYILYWHFCYMTKTTMAKVHESMLEYHVVVIVA